MPRIRRWFHLSQDLNRDPEFREYAKKFGLGGVRFWLEVLAILDRTDNFLDLHKGFDLGLLAGTCETKKHIIQASYQHLIDINWLRVGIDVNQRLFIYAPKWAEYNKRREHEGSMKDTNRYQQGTYPTPSPYPSLFHKKEIHKEKSLDSKTSEDSLNGFEEFWGDYPDRNGKKLDKPEAQKQFVGLSKEDQVLAIRAAKNYAASELIQKGIGIKDPKRFLNNGNGSEPWRNWIKPEQPKTAVNDSSQVGKEAAKGARGRKSTFPPAGVYCKLHYDRSVICMTRAYVDTEMERFELVEKGWLCDEHKEVFIGQVNEDHISTLKTEE